MSKELLLKAKKRKKRKNCRNGECKAKNQVLKKAPVHELHSGIDRMISSV